nr:hypothetical protein B0A51_10342 [Rachicladosporium sp. CCFEE 5018]
MIAVPDSSTFGNDDKREQCAEATLCLLFSQERAPLVISWKSRKSLREHARTCSFCAYLVDRSSNANLWPIRKTERFPKTAGSIRLVDNKHRVGFGVLTVTDLQFTGYAGLISLAFKRHTTPSVHVGIRQVGPLFDNSIGKAWLSRCVKDHDHIDGDDEDDDYEADSGSPSALQGSTWVFRTIDTALHCIREHVRGQPRPKYAALSYVWGSAPQLTLRRANKTASMEEGGLIAANIELPVAVQDAISGAASLGFKHIWIDALCIVEDDELDKAAQINSLRAIYRQAALTIVSTAPSVHDGMSGINSVPRSLTQRPFRTARFDLIDRLPGVHNMLDHCEWYTRG